MIFQPICEGVTMRQTSRERFEALWFLLETEEICPARIAAVIGCSERQAYRLLRRKRRGMLYRPTGD
jgi:hypothetical protein